MAGWDLVAVRTYVRLFVCNNAFVSCQFSTPKDKPSSVVSTHSVSGLWYLGVIAGNVFSSSCCCCYLCFLLYSALLSISCIYFNCCCINFWYVLVFFSWVEQWNDNNSKWRLSRFRIFFCCFHGLVDFDLWRGGCYVYISLRWVYAFVMKICVCESWNVKLADSITNHLAKHFQVNFFFFFSNLS